MRAADAAKSATILRRAAAATRRFRCRRRRCAARYAAAPFDAAAYAAANARRRAAADADVTPMTRFAASASVRRRRDDMPRRGRAAR